jgi:hypothetical protein
MKSIEKWFVRVWAIGLVVFSAWVLNAMLLGEIISDPTFPGADRTDSMKSAPSLTLYLIMGILQLGLFFSTTGYSKSLRTPIIIGMVPFATLLLISLFSVLGASAMISTIGLSVLLPVFFVSIFLYGSAFLRMHKLK